MILQNQLLEWIIILTILPYWLLLGLYGFTKIKRLLKQDWPSKKRGIAETVSKYEQMSSEERMEINKRKILEGAGTTPPTIGKASWLDVPTPKDETKDMNERVYKEGLVHDLPKTESHDNS